MAGSPAAPAMNSTPHRTARPAPASAAPDVLHPPALPHAAPAARGARALWLALGLALAGCSDKAPPPAPRGPVEVGVVTVQPERQSVTTELPGRTSAHLVAEIRPQVGGIVQKRLFTEGADVKAGQVLYQLDPAPFEAALASAEASLARAQATAGSAESNARRNAELAKIEAVSRQVSDDSQAAAQQARSDVAVARASVETARINLGYARIRAPISGRTAISTVTPGALVTANQTTALTTISQLDPLYVDVTQSSTEVLRWKTDLAQGRLQRAGEGQARMRLKLEDGSTYALDMSDDVDQLGGFAELAWVRSGLLTDEEMQEAAATMERGTLAVLIVYENTWAVPFIAAAKEAGGELIAGARIPAQDVMDALDALEAPEAAGSRQPVAATPSGA